jgi:hypothetical protein
MNMSSAWLPRFPLSFQATSYLDSSGAVLMKISPPVTVRCDQLTSTWTVSAPARHAAMSIWSGGCTAVAATGRTKARQKAALAARTTFRRMSGPPMFRLAWRIAHRRR